MVFIFVARGLYHALETLTPEKRTVYRIIYYFLFPGPGLESKH